MKSNIVLIGMPGCGKSTLGVLMAKALGYEFLDTDLVLQRQEGKLLQQIIDEDGLAYFEQAEERALCGINVSHTIIATGGSAVYCDAAMKHLRENGTIVWLSLPYEEIERRIQNITTRGIVLAPGKTLRDVYEERQPLYQRWADMFFNCHGSVEDTLSKILELLDVF
ncbi:MAG: shikimate kinase [Clostridia bacterium]|nr:shikimate kinase [Clostridia bacterium]